MFLKALKYILYSMIGVLLAVCCLYGIRVASAEDEGILCRRMELHMGNFSSCRFVTSEDVEQAIRKECGEILGKRLGDLDLRTVENAVLSLGAVGSAEVYVTRDSVLNVDLKQKEPFLRFQSPAGGFYCDSGGNIFPLQERAAARVPLVEGNIPVNVGKSYCGPASSDWERQWMDGILALEKYIQSSRIWKSRIAQIHIEKNGDIVLIPVEGEERFIFGGTGEMEEKFERMECYYRAVRPAADSSYRTVNLKFKDQIICRK